MGKINSYINRYIHSYKESLKVLFSIMSKKVVESWTAAASIKPGLTIFWETGPQARDITPFFTVHTFHHNFHMSTTKNISRFDVDIQGFFFYSLIIFFTLSWLFAWFCAYFCHFFAYFLHSFYKFPLLPNRDNNT